MAILLKRQHNLPTLVLAIERPTERTSARGQAVFTLQVGDMTIVEARVATADLNMPANLRELNTYQYHDPNYTIPPGLIAQIQSHLPAILAPGAPLWLLFDTSAGFLPLAPWEKLLQPLLGVPLLRIPNFLINPLADASSLDVAICASSPLSEPSFPLDQVLVRIASQLLQTVQRRVQIDLFADARVYSNLQAAVNAAGIGAQVRVHNPREFYASRPHTAETQNTFRGSWLEWISSALAGRSIDLAYFVGHGCLTDDNGFLLMAESPMRNQDHEIFIGSQQLESFLTSAGAWVVGFSAPPQNYSGSGLRLLASQLARARPGPLLLHEFADDQTCQQLGQAFGFLFNATGTAPSSPAIALYCHPDYVRSEISSGYGIESAEGKLGELTLAQSDECRRLLQSKDEAPGWLSKSQRVLEKSAAELERTEPFESTRSSTRAGSERALSFVADVLARYATSQPPSGTSEHSDKDNAL
jgi:hypothetical protein